MPLVLLVAIAINLAVAWRCAYWQQMPMQPDPGATAQQLWDRWIVSDPAGTPAQFYQTTGAFGCDFLLIERPLPPGTNASHPRMMITRAGFPMRSFEAMHSWNGAVPAHAGGVRIESVGNNVAWLSMLPLTPMPLGFVVNTLLYAAVIWCMTIAPAMVIRDLRRARRLSQTHCAGCGYDQRGLPEARCPECGAMHQPGAVPRTGNRVWLRCCAVVMLVTYLPPAWLLVPGTMRSEDAERFWLFALWPSLVPAILWEAPITPTVALIVVILWLAVWVAARNRMALIMVGCLLFAASCCQSLACHLSTR